MKESSESLKKKQYFFFRTEKWVFANRDGGLLEKYLRQWKKMDSTNQKVSFHQQE